MDTFKDKQHLEDLNQGSAPWKVWNYTTDSLANCTCQPLGQREEQPMAVSVRP
jgi:hypothetical protein